MKSTTCVAAASIGVGMCGGSASAGTVLFTQISTTPSVNTFVTSDDSPLQRMADNFTHSHPSSIDRISFWGSFFDGTLFADASPTGSIRFEILASDGGTPGAALAAQVISFSSISAIPTGRAHASLTEFAFTADLFATINLPAGEYFLSIRGFDTSLDTRFGWSLGANAGDLIDNTSFSQNTLQTSEGVWGQINNDFVFTLEGSMAPIIPLPTALVMGLAGIGLVAACRRR